MEVRVLLGAVLLILEVAVSFTFDLSVGRLL